MVWVRVFLQNPEDLSNDPQPYLRLFSYKSFFDSLGIIFDVGKYKIVKLPFTN